MATYTDNYQLTLPTYAEVADIATINNNMTKIDEIMHASQISMATAYDATRTSENPYNTGDIVMYEKIAYRCKEDGVYGTWDASKWEQTTLADNLGGGDASEISYDNTTSGMTATNVQDAIDELEGNIEDVSDGLDDAVESLAPAYNPTETYNEGDIVSKDNKLYQCNTEDTTGDWDSTKWDEYVVSEHMGEGGSTVTITPETIAEPKQKIADFEIDGASGSLYAPIVEIDGHASGAIATFTDGGDNKPLKSLKVAINPVQASGTPTPENPIPIYGWAGAEICNADIKGLTGSSSNSLTRQFHVNWADGNNNYDMPLNIVANETVKDENDNDISVATLESEYVLPFDVVYDAPEAIIALDNGQTLLAGDYYFKIINDSWGGNNNKYVSFTLNSELSGTKQIRKMSGAYDAAIENCTLGIYTSGKDAVGTALAFTVGTEEPSSGTSLGQTDGTSYCNYWHCVVLGYNRWKYSAIRQYLNSDATATNWWSQQHKWDVMPSYADTKNGFLYGLSDDVKASLKITKIATARNTVFNSGDTPLGDFDYTYDKIFLAALEQMYIQPQESSEGTYWPYYKELLNVNSPVARGATYPELKKYDLAAKTTSRSRWLRSCYRGGANAAWYVLSSGNVLTYHAYDARRCAPCLRIEINDKKSITWSEAGTVYGGYIEFKDGEWKAYKTWKRGQIKDLSWTYYSSSNVFRNQSIKNVKVMTEIYKTVPYVSWNLLNNYEIECGSSDLIIKDTDYSDATSFVAGVGDAYIFYEINPEPFTLDAPLPNIQTLLGDNNIWSDTGDILECVYQRDLNLVINQFDARITALEQALSGTRSLSLSKSATTEEVKEEKEEETKEEQR